MAVFKSRFFSAAIRILVAILLGVIVLNAGVLILMSQPPPSETDSDEDWVSPFIIHTSMLVLSCVLILLLSRGKISLYGFRKPDRMPVLPMVIWGCGIGIISAIVGNLLGGEQADSSFIQTVIFIWIYASICEEVLTRGLIQGFLAPLSEYGFNIFRLRISVPVLTAALFFGLMHLALLTTGMHAPAVVNIVFFAFILGLAAGYFREKTGSLIPAIMIHMFGNVGGSIVDFASGLLR